MSNQKAAVIWCKIHQLFIHTSLIYSFGFNLGYVQLCYQLKYNWKLRLVPFININIVNAIII